MSNKQLHDTIAELKYKVDVYERVLHKLQMCAVVTLDSKELQKTLDCVYKWSKAQRTADEKTNSSALKILKRGINGN